MGQQQFEEGLPVVIAFTSTKGGTGKTTKCANIGALLADMGMKTLLIDGDFQPSLSKYFPLETRAPGGLVEVVRRGGVIQQDCISKTNRPNLDIVVSNDPSQGGLQTWLKDRGDRLGIMRRACRRSPGVSDYYDVILIDTQGAKGELQQSCALAANIIISPVNPTILSSREFASGTMEMLNELNCMSDFSTELRPGDVFALINQSDRTNDSRTIEEEIRSNFRNSRNVRVMQTVVPTAAAYKTAASIGKPAYEIEVPSKRKATSAYLTCHEIVWEIFPNFRDIYYTDVQEGTTDNEDEEGGTQ